MPTAATRDHLVRADVRLPEDLLDLVDQVAEEEFTSRSSVIRRAVHRDMAGRAHITDPGSS